MQISQIWSKQAENPDLDLSFDAPSNQMLYHTRVKTESFFLAWNTWINMKILPEAYLTPRDFQQKNSAWSENFEALCHPLLRAVPFLQRTRFTEH